MRFLAVVSVFFAMTQVAFAAPVSRASDVLTRNIQLREMGIAELAVHGQHQMNSAPLFAGHPSVSPPRYPGPVAPTILTHHVLLGDGGAVHRMLVTNDGAIHGITHAPVYNPADGTFIHVAVHKALMHNGKMQMLGHVFTPEGHTIIHALTIHRNGVQSGAMGDSFGRFRR
ncbi:hypothetical protein K439DRAFT_1616767 [Ramaria rubella]|nr:hypothetical protein K439DRAFT_1616767 [Ramaria rubella]